MRKNVSPVASISSLLWPDQITVAKKMVAMDSLAELERQFAILRDKYAFSHIIRTMLIVAGYMTSALVRSIGR